MDKKKENIYEFYEKNISPLTPSIVDNINRSLITYKENDMKMAIMIAVNSNIRTWKYISAVLHRIDKEGGVNKNGNGTYRQDIFADRSDEYLRKYLKNQHRN